MLPYYIISGFLLLSGVISVDKRGRKYDFVVLLFLCVIVILLSGLRACGYDYYSYQEHFDEVPDILHFHRTYTSLEIGYEYFVSLTKTFFNNYNVHLFIYAAINIILAAVLCRKYSPYPTLSFLLFCGTTLFGQVMGQMRQPMANCIMFLLILPLLIHHKNWKAFGLVVIVGLLFHKSILLVALCIPFLNRKFNRKQLRSGVIACAVIFLFSASIKPIMLSLIPKGFFLSNALVAYMTYRATSFAFSFGMIERVLLLYLCFHYGSKYKLYGNNVLYTVLTNMFCFGVMVYFCFIQIAAEFASRGTKGLYMSIILILPIIIKNAPSKDKTILIYGTLLWVAYLLCSFLFNPPAAYNPYIPAL